MLQKMSIGLKLMTLGTNRIDRNCISGLASLSMLLEQNFVI